VSPAGFQKVPALALVRAFYVYIAYNLLDVFSISQIRSIINSSDNQVMGVINVPLFKFYVLQ